MASIRVLYGGLMKPDYDYSELEDRVNELEAFCSELYMYFIANDKPITAELLDKLDNAASGYPIDYLEE